MFKGSPELVAQRREEIINACERLYQTQGFREITLKDIGAVTAFSRPTIYNYFQTKEEIFLALFKREYDRWNAELRKILDEHEALSRKELAETIAESLRDRKQFLRLLSMNNFDMEANSRPEMLTDFKRSYGESLRLVAGILEKFCPDMSAGERESVVYAFFPFMFGVYPYAETTEKQRVAMKEAGIDFAYKNVYELVRTCLTRLLDA